MGAAAGVTADRLVAEQGWRTRTVRQFMQTAGMLGPAACLCAAVFEPRADLSYVYGSATKYIYMGKEGKGGGVLQICRV